MDPTRLLTQTCTITRVAMTGTDDAFGDPTEQTTTATYVCWLHQVGRGEQTANANTQTEMWSMYLDPAADGLVDGGDRATIDGVTYELDGPPWAAHNPRTGDITHLEVGLRRTR